MSGVTDLAPWLLAGLLAATGGALRLHQRPAPPPPTDESLRPTRIVVIDGLRADRARDPAVMPWLNAQQARFGIATAADPTMTGTAVFALGTGYEPTRLEALDGFEPPPAPAGNLFDRLAAAGHEVHLLGDATWTHRYGRWATSTAPMKERGHDDTHESDAATLAALSPGPGVTVIHLVGPDHVAHADGVGDAYDARLSEIDRALAALPPAPTLVLSDHGVDDRGSHGHGEPEARRAPVAYFPATGPPLDLTQAQLAHAIARGWGVELEPAARSILNPVPFWILVAPAAALLLFTAGRWCEWAVGVGAVLVAVPFVEWWPPFPDPDLPWLVALAGGLGFALARPRHAPRVAAVLAAVVVTGAITLPTRSYWYLSTVVPFVSKAALALAILPFVALVSARRRA